MALTLHYISGAALPAFAPGYPKYNQANSDADYAEILVKFASAFGTDASATVAMFLAS